MSTFVADPSIGFNFQDKSSAKEWSVKQEWTINEVELMDKVSDLAREQQQFQKAHGKSPILAHLEEIAKAAGISEADLAFTEEEQGFFDTYERFLARANQSTVDGEISKDLVPEALNLSSLLGEKIKELEVSTMSKLSTAEPGELSAAQIALHEKLFDAVDKDFIIDEDDEVFDSKTDPAVVAEAFKNVGSNIFNEPVREAERAEALLGLDAQVDLEKSMRAFNEHTAKFSSVRLEPKIEDTVEADVQELARLLANNPSFSEKDVEESLSYYRQMVSVKGSAATNTDYKKEFPQLDFKQVAPWTYNREVRLPGVELAARIGEDWKYQDVPTPLSERYASLLAEAEAQLGPENVKHVKEMLDALQSDNALGKQ